MASTYSDRLKLELMETGANANTWGNNTNTNLETLDAFTAGYLSKSVAGSANVTLTTNNADPTAESSNKVIEFTGTLTGNIYVFIPAVENNYIFFNNTSGAFTLTVAPTGHAANGVAITQGAHTIMYNNANNEIKDLFSGSLGNLSLVSGGVFTGNASGASAINASNVSSGTLASDRLPSIPDAKLSANVTLNNASTISAGTLSNDRLDTVPTTKGGTGLTSIGSAGQVLTVSSPGSALEFADAGGGGYNLVMFNTPGTYNPPADIHTIKVTVQAGGGGGGGANAQTGSSGGGGGGTAIEHIAAASIPGPVSVTVGGGGTGGGSATTNNSPPTGNAGGASSFGSFCSATGGGAGGPSASKSPGSAGTGTGGDLNADGGAGAAAGNEIAEGGGSFHGAGGRGGRYDVDSSQKNGHAGAGKGAGGGGGGRSANFPTGTGGTGGAGSAGFVMVEEYLG